MAVISSNGTGGGNWLTGASWAGGVAPIAGDSYIIVTGDTITVDGTVTVGDDTNTAGTVQAGATLFFTRMAGTYVFTNRGGISFAGTIDLGTVADPIPLGTNWEFRAGHSAGTPERLVNATATASRFYIHGAVRKRWTRMTRDVLVATPSTIYVSDATGWQVGDTIGVEDTHNWYHPVDTFYPGSLAGSAVDMTEIRVINTITGPTLGEWQIDLTAALTHVNADASRNAHHLNGAVGNMTSNVVVLGTVTATPRIKFGTNAGTFNITAPLYDWRHLRFSAGADGFGGSLSDTHNSATLFSFVSPFFIDSVAFYDWRQIATGCNNIKVRMPYVDCVFWGTAFSGSVAYHIGPFSMTRCALLRRGAGSFEQAGASTVNLLLTRCVVSGTFDWSQFGFGQLGMHQFDDCQFRMVNQPLYMNWNGRTTFNRCTFALSVAEDAVNGVGYPSWNDSAIYQVNSRPITVFNNCRMSEYVGQFGRMIFGSLLDLNNANGFLTGMGQPQTAGEYSTFTYSGVNGDPTYQRIFTNFGYIKRAVANAPLLDGAAPPSALRFEPQSIGAPLTNSWKLFAPAGRAIVVTAKVYKSSGTEPDPDRGGTFANYTGLDPVFIAVGTQDTATATVIGANGAWLEVALVYTSTLPDDEIITLTFGCQSGQGAVWVTNLAAPLPFALDTGPQQWWTDGAPVQYVVSNYSVPADTWNVLTSSLTTAGTIGELFANIEDGNDTREVLRLLLAVLVGETTGGPGAPVFKSLDGTKNRVVGTATAVGDRTRTSIDPT
jgi:hypothetical protein